MAAGSNQWLCPRRCASPVIAEVVDKNQFMDDLRVELSELATGEGIPFDTGYFWITIEAK